MLQQDQPGDFVVATGETHSVREFCEVAFGHAGLDWQQHVVTDEQFFRPAEVDLLVGNPARAEKVLGWRPKTTFAELVRSMVDADLPAPHGQAAGHLLDRPGGGQDVWPVSTATRSRHQSRRSASVSLEGDLRRPAGGGPQPAVVAPQDGEVDRPQPLGVEHDPHRRVRARPSRWSATSGRPRPGPSTRCRPRPGSPRSTSRR